MFASDLSAVVLSAGKGSRICELTANCPKCLVPIANKPMIYYPLEALIKANFNEVIVIVMDNEEEVIQKAINELKLDIRVDFVSIPNNKDFGTADSLRLIKDRVKNDLLVMSCDTITDFPLNRFIDLNRIYSPTLLALISTVHNPNENPIPGRKGREKPEKDLIGIDVNNDNRLVFLSSEVDFDESVSFNVSMIEKCPQMTIKSNLMDAHIYVLKKWVLRYLEENEKISSLKGEFLPSLVRKQFRRETKPSNKTSLKTSSIISMSAVPHKQVFDFIEPNDIELGLQNLEPNNGPEEPSIESLRQQMPNIYPESKVKCFAYRLEDGYCVRANTLSGYCEANRIILKSMNVSDRKAVKGQSPISARAQLDGIIGNVKSIGDKCSIKRCVIGNNCSIGDKVKLMNTIVMDSVTIEEGSNIQGSIICSFAHIERNAEIKDCIIGSKQTVHPMAKFTNEVIMDIEQMMEL